jgi:sulfate adenylyltransferase
MKDTVTDPSTSGGLAADATVQHTVHGADLSWLHLILLSVLPPTTGPADRAHSDDQVVRAPAFELAGNDLTPGDIVDLLDPEGVTLAQLTVESVEGSSVAGNVEPRSGFSVVDHTDLRGAPADLAPRWPDDRPVRALWSDGTLTFAVREAARAAARADGASLLELVPLPTGSETNRVANAPVRLARAEQTRDEQDRLVVVPWPAPVDQDAAAALTAAIAAAFGATELLVTDPLRAGREGPLPTRLVDVPDEYRTAPSELVDEWVLDGRPLPGWIAEPSVAAELARVHRPASRNGLTVLLSGLSGSGKSTVARSLAVRLVEHEARSVSLLDGDVVRHHLSKGLGFSRPDRITNVLRIGFVAGEITKAGGIAICCPIAPYDQTRKQVRDMVEEHGRFVLVHVATPLAECERRDRKGLYAKARRGEIPEFTGISDPYETPTDAEVVVDTTGRSIAECVDQVFEYLEAQGLVEGAATG